MAIYLPATLGPLVRCAAGDVGRYSMTGVHVSDPGDGTFCCATTDGRNLLVARGVCPGRGRLIEEPEAPGDDPVGVAVVVPTAAWNELFRKAPRLMTRQPDRTEPVTVEKAAANRIRLATRDRSLHCEPVEGRFPDWTQIIPKTQPAFAIAVNPELLANLLTAISHILGDETQRVTLAFWKPDTPMAVVAKDKETGVCLDGLLMPLTDHPPVKGAV